MDHDLYVVQQVPSGRLKGIFLDILSDEKAKKISSMSILSANGVSDAALGLPTSNATECLTCGARSSKDGPKSSKDCEGHFGLIDLPCTVLNPYYMTEIAQILNKICPGCKSIRDKKLKKVDTRQDQPQDCRYCSGKHKDGYPKMKFKVASKDVFAKTAIVVEVDENSLNKSSSKILASDYWDIIPKDSAQENSGLQSNKRVMLPAQVYIMLKGVCPRTLEALLRRKNSIFLNSILVTPNSHRVREFGGRITFDESTRMYRRIVDHKGTPNELSVRVLDLYKGSKIRSEKLSPMQQIYEKQSNNDSVSSASGMKNMKELLLGKRTDHSFRMVVVGDPSIKVDEIGLPVQIAANLLISDHIYEWNWNKIEPCCDFMLHRSGQFSISRKGERISIVSKDMLRTEDAINRPLIDGDIVLINRPPSIHQHSLIALSVKILPINSVVSINPLICSPLRGDFDGDCLHGYVPQSVNSRVELKELVSLDKQLVDGQSGQNLLSLGQDSLTAAHLVLEDGVLFNKPEIQQLQMYCSSLPILPAIIPSKSTEASLWTGKQLFNLLFPPDFEFSYEPGGVCIRQGELVSSSHGTAWLRDSGENLFQCLLRHCPEKALDFLYAAQEVLCEWLTRRGLSVSLSDLYLCSDPESRKNLVDDISCGLQEAEKMSDISLLMVRQNQHFLVDSSTEDESMLNNLKELLNVARQTSAELCKYSVSASKSVFRDMQNLIYQYAGNNNSFMAMLKAGSKGNLQKLFQHSMCLGLQHSATPLSFSIPHSLSCASWNNQKNNSSFYKLDGTREITDTYIPCTVVPTSYLEGLNPLECYVHSLTSRDSSFSGQADVSGTITRKLMFFMRDLMIGYDGTVRNSYGNQVVQFNYCTDDMFATQRDSVVGGDPVGSLAACAISEAAYGALDQPVSALESSPLMALKKVLECGVKKNTGPKSASLFLSRRLGRWVNGFECAALEIKHHLESLVLSNVVSEVVITHKVSEENSKNATSWICHFHISKEVAEKKRLKLESITKALNMNCNSTGVKKKIELPELLIENKVCSEADCDKKSASKLCISVAVVSKNPEFRDLDYHRSVVIPVLLQTVIRGFPEFKKVDILWKDKPSCTKFPKSSSGELFLRIFMSDHCERTKFWSILKEKCLKIWNIIDWERSHPDDIHSYSEYYGIDVAWHCFVNGLHSAISDTGKTILPQHLIITANCLSVTGEFVPLNAKGLSQQRKEADVFTPFMQACFSNPSVCLVKAAKMGQRDGLQGSLDALAWGQTPPIGTGGQFELIYSGKGHEPKKPTDVYSMLKSHVEFVKPNESAKLSVKLDSSDSVSQWQFLKKNGRKSLVNGTISQHSALDEIYQVSRTLKHMLHEYAIGCKLSGEDKSTAIRALQFHPRWKEKIGTGDVEIKVGSHPMYEDSRCFYVVRKDGTEVDISYHKSIHNALALVNPYKAKGYQSKWINGK